MCEVHGCDRVVNRDGLCFPHKIKTIHMDIDGLRRDNRGEGAAGNMGNREYVKDMYEKRRSAGMSDPEPANSEAAKLAPAIGTRGGKKYRAANGGL